MRSEVLARFETLILMRSSTVQVSAKEARVEGGEGQILILHLTPVVLLLLSEAGRLPPPIERAGETWGAPRVTGGARLRRGGRVSDEG